MRQLRTPTRNPRRTVRPQLHPLDTESKHFDGIVAADFDLRTVSALRPASTRSACGVAGFSRSRVERGESRPFHTSDVRYREHGIAPISALEDATEAPCVPWTEC